MKTAQRNRIEQHGLNLLEIFPNATERDPVKLCKRLRRLEAKGHKLAEDYCNGDIGEDELKRRQLQILAPLHALLGSDRPWLNSDPRGYALKVYLKKGEVLHRDWGDYGIIAPEIND